MKINLDSTPHVDSLSYRVFSDVFEEGGAGHTIFHGGFGLINFQGIVKPTFHAYRFLNALGDEEISRSEKGIVTRHSSNGKVSALFYHYDEQAVPTAVPLAATFEKAKEIQSKGSPISLDLHWRELKSGTEFELEWIGKESGYAVPLWERKSYYPYSETS